MQFLFKTKGIYTKNFMFKNNNLKLLNFIKMSIASSNQQNYAKNDSNYPGIKNFETLSQTSKQQTKLPQINKGFINEKNSCNSGKSGEQNNKRISLELKVKVNAAQKNESDIQKIDQSQKQITFSHLPISQKEYSKADRSPKQTKEMILKHQQQKKINQSINKVKIKPSVHSFEKKQQLPKKQQEQLEEELLAKKKQISNSFLKEQEKKKTFVYSQNFQLKIQKQISNMLQVIQIIKRNILVVKSDLNQKKVQEQRLKQKNKQLKQLKQLLLISEQQQKKRKLKAEQQQKERKLKAEQQQKESKLRGKIKQEQIKISKLKARLNLEQLQKNLEKAKNSSSTILYEKQMRKIAVQQNIAQIQKLISDHQTKMKRTDKQIQRKYEKQATSIQKEIYKCKKNIKNYQQQLEGINKKEDKRQILPSILQQANKKNLFQNMISLSSKNKYQNGKGKEK